jgi:hypothetical protein
MHDLNTIARLNAEAVEKSIRHFQGQGRWVLARYEGARIGSVETFSSGNAAQAALDMKPANAQQGETATIFAPLPAHQVVGRRDQSEDRPQPAQDITLGDYIARKSAMLDNPTE